MWRDREILAIISPISSLKKLGARRSNWRTFLCSIPVPAAMSTKGKERGQKVGRIFLTRFSLPWTRGPRSGIERTNPWIIRTRPGRVHGDRPRLSMTRRPKKDAPRSVPNRCGARFLAPFLTRRAENERCRGSLVDRAGVSKERPSGRCDAGGHWMPADRSTSWLGAPQAGAPWGASWLSA